MHHAAIVWLGRKAGVPELMALGMGARSFRTWRRYCTDALSADIAALVTTHKSPNSIEVLVEKVEDLRVGAPGETLDSVLQAPAEFLVVTGQGFLEGT